MIRWRWWAVVATLLASNCTAYALLYFERTKHAAASALIEGLSRRAAVAETRAAAVLQEKRQLTETAGKMTRRLEARTVKGAVRNATGVLTEAIPYVGVAAMLAITAADLNDACDTMKDINALHDTLGLEPAEDNRVCGLSVPTLKDMGTTVRNWCAKTSLYDEPAVAPTAVDQNAALSFPHAASK